MSPRTLARVALLAALLLLAAIVIPACPGHRGDDDDNDVGDDSSDDAGDDSADDTGGGPAIVSTENSACKSGGAAKDWPQSLTFDYADDILAVTHVNGVFNCCLNRIDVTMELDGFVLDLYEAEDAPSPCNCLCPFDVTTRIAGLASWTYTVNAYDNGAFAVSGQVTIP